MPHEAGHEEETQVIPPVQLPPGVVPTPQSGTSRDTLALAKQQAVDPNLPVGTAINPVAQNVGTGEMLATPGVSTTAPTSAVPTATATQATAMTPVASQQVADPQQQSAAQYTATVVGTAPITFIALPIPPSALTLIPLKSARVLGSFPLPMNSY